MQKPNFLKYFSWLLIVVILTATINCGCESAHAEQDHQPAENGLAFTPEISASHQCPCDPAEQHEDFDGCCDSCLNCVCHAPLAIQSFHFSYNPTTSDLSTFDPFKHLPEVYLSRFIPPQIQA